MIPDYRLLYEISPSESSAVSTLLYAVNLQHKLRKYPSIYISCELESTFNETSNPKMTDTVTGQICKHANMNPNEFNEFPVNSLLKRLSK